MPPRVPSDHYDTIDFTSLALQYPAFARKLKGNGQLDFSDPESVRLLTTCLLNRDFGLTVTFPPDRLCPPVPNRFNYIIFLQRLLDSTSPTFRGSGGGGDQTRDVVGLDIGTGALAIYPLLGTRQFANWRFFATEIDEISLASAAENISLNGLGDRIKLVDVSKSSLIPIDALFPDTATATAKKAAPAGGAGAGATRVHKIDFVMTNPPFYASTAEMTASARLKSRPPNSSCTGSVGEMVYQYREDLLTTTSDTSTGTGTGTGSSAALKQALATGGEVAFVAQLLQESSSPSLRHRIQWFSAMLGKLSSLPPLINLIHEFHAQVHNTIPSSAKPNTTNPSTSTSSSPNYAVTEFVQGQKTRRWCLAWSWMRFRPSPALARAIPASALEKRLLPAVSEYQFSFAVVSVATVSVAVNQVLQGLVLEANLHHSNNKHGDGDGESDGYEEVVMWQWKSKISMGLAALRRDCWSRKARRKRQQQHQQQHDNDNDIEDEDEDEDDNDNDNDEPALVVAISVKHEQPTTSSNNKAEIKAETVVRTRWMKGIDGVLFESFCGWLKRKVETRVKT